ncbi:MAG: hypothetical protein KDB65_04535 [Calditrichaeota bacterium]|nr:hypothetical protein [Calditrichota bacterium]MCB9368413.1 hypothetical protein [Calditrichota bacterium]
MMRARSICIALLAIFGAAFAVDTVRIGDPIGYTVRIPVADSVLVIEPDDVPVRVLPFDFKREMSGNNFEFYAAVYDTGTVEIPALPVLIFDKGQVTDTVWTEPREVAIESVLPDTASTPLPNKPYEDHPLRFADIAREYWPWALAAAILAGLVYAWVRYRKRPKKGEEPPPPPPLPPAELAVRQLIALKEKKYPERGMLKEQYSEFSEILRRYVEGRFEFPALEMTTYELAAELKRENIPSCLREELLPVLRESDLVKFAKQIPALAQSEAIVDLGFSIVDRTKPSLEVRKEEQAV